MGDSQVYTIVTRHDAREFLDILSHDGMLDRTKTEQLRHLVNDKAHWVIAASHPTQLEEIDQRAEAPEQLEAPPRGIHFLAEIEEDDLSPVYHLLPGYAWFGSAKHGRHCGLCYERLDFGKKRLAAARACIRLQITKTAQELNRWFHFWGDG